MGNILRAILPRNNPDNILSTWSLKYRRNDLEQKYLDCHWLVQTWWVKAAIVFILLYSIFWSLVYSVGSADIIAAMDFRSAHYQATHNTKVIMDQVDKETDSDSADQREIGEVEPIRYDNGQLNIHPYTFIAWHLIWCFLFIFLIVIDRCFVPAVQEHRKTSERYNAWPVIRHWSVCGIMTTDLIVTAFVNPTLTRFLLFVYVLLIRVTWVQAVWLVVVCSVAIVMSGQVGTHIFLNPTSVSEFVLINLATLAATRQLEVNQRLSMYRLWVLKYCTNLSRNDNNEWRSDEILSFKHFDLHTIPEDSRADDPSNCPTPPDDEFSEMRLQVTPPTSPNTRTLDGNIKILSSDEDQLADFVEVQKSITENKNNISSDLKEIRSIPLVDLKLSIPPQGGGSEPSTPLSNRSKNSEISGCSWQTAESKLAIQVQAHLRDPLTRLQVSTQQYTHNPNKMDPWNNDGGINNSWSDGVLETFSFRGKTYLEDRKKETCPAEVGTMFSLNSVKCFHTKDKIWHLATKIKSMQSFLREHPNEFFLITNRMCPVKPNKVFNIVSIFVKNISINDNQPPHPSEALWEMWRKGSSELRNKHFKYISDLNEAPYLLRKTISMLGGVRKPVIMGKGYLDQQYFDGPNYIEVDVDTSSSSIARSIMSKILGISEKCIVDEVFLLEGQEKQYLPERPLCMQRFIHCNMPKISIDLQEKDLYTDQEIEERNSLPLSPSFNANNVFSPKITKTLKESTHLDRKDDSKISKTLKDSTPDRKDTEKRGTIQTDLRKEDLLKKEDEEFSLSATDDIQIIMKDDDSLPLKR